MIELSRNSACNRSTTGAAIKVSEWTKSYMLLQDIYKQLNNIFSFNYNCNISKGKVIAQYNQIKVS